MNSLTFPVGFIFDSTSPGELFLIFGVVLLLFGPKRLPEIARMIGRAMIELRRASLEFKDQVMRMDEEPVEKPHPPAETPPDTGILPEKTATSPEIQPPDQAHEKNVENPVDRNGKGNTDDLAG